VVVGPDARLIPVAVTLSVMVQNGRVVNTFPNVTATPDVAVALHSPATSVLPATMVHDVPLGAGLVAEFDETTCPKNAKPSPAVSAAFAICDSINAAADAIAKRSFFISFPPKSVGQRIEQACYTLRSITLSRCSALGYVVFS
jgi:hypothetical protein